MYSSPLFLMSLLVGNHFNHQPPRQDRPSWLAASATHPPLADAAKAAENAATAVASTATADALRGAAKALKSAGHAALGG